MKTVHRICTLLTLLLLLSLLSACRKTPSYREYAFIAMDTVVTLYLAPVDTDGNALPADVPDRAAADCEAILADFEAEISAHTDSPVSQFNENALPALPLTDSIRAMLDTADTAADLTGGAYDYTLGALSELWNVKGGGPVPSDDAIREALSHTGRGLLTRSDGTLEKTDPGVLLDFGGIGKGAAAELLIDYLNTTGIGGGFVSLGGNIALFGEKSPGTPDAGAPYVIGVRDPRNTAAVVGYLHLTDGYVSVSGDYERYFEENGRRYHHILDPAAGAPADSGLASAAVWSTDGTAADALSTALFVLGAERSLELYETSPIPFEAVFVTTEGEILVTPGIADGTVPFERSPGR